MSFATVPLPITAEEATQLATLRVADNGNWDYFGSPKNVSHHIAMVALELGNPVSVASELFSDRVAEVFGRTLDCLRAPAGWLCIRGFMATDLAKPRWHTDGKFFLSANPGPDEVQMKLAFCVKGRTTLFATLSDTDRAESDLIERESGAVNDRLRQSSESFDRARVELHKARANELQEHMNSIALRGQVVAPVTALEAGLFAVGQSPKAALHSEPPFDLSRIFVSIVPGTVAQISELQKRWQGG